jgi:hypothetical protein
MRSGNAALDRTLAAWAKEYRAEHVPADVQKLINLATYDLWHGPVGDGAVGDPALDEYGQENEWAGYPGFVSATEKIGEVFDDVPSTLYVDTGAECWSEREPGPDECGECCGRGEICTEPYLDDTYEVGRAQLVRAIVGKELAEYL